MPVYGLTPGQLQKSNDNLIVKFPTDASSPADVPSEDDVRDGVSYGAGLFTGNMTEPSESDVRSGVEYGTNGTEFTGTLAGGGGANSLVY